MKDVVGRPGTRSGLTLRVLQFAFATATLVTVATASGPEFDSFSAFFFLGCSMFIQILWSFPLACIDVVCLVGNRELNQPRAISIMLVGDWVIGVLAFSAAASSAGVTIFLKKDTQYCRALPQLVCDQYELSVILGFMAWSLIAASALSLFWFRASL